MKKTIKVPFDVEKAKAGARVVTRDGRKVRILCYDRKDAFPIVALFGDAHEMVNCYTINGDGTMRFLDLFILEEVEEEPTFKPFDRVLVRDGDTDKWFCDTYSHYSNNNKVHICSGEFGYLQCIPYEGNEHLVGTTDNPE